jgi:hypothetical protein
VPKIGADDLASGSPAFIVDFKAYGRLPAFLLQAGLAQLEVDPTASITRR